MKNLIKIFILFVASAIFLTFVSCKSDSDDGGGESIPVVTKTPETGGKTPGTPNVEGKDSEDTEENEDLPQNEDIEEPLDESDNIPLTADEATGLYNVYVSESGSNDSGLGTADAPFATLQKAVNVIKYNNNADGDFIIYVGGTIRGTTNISGLAAKSLVITGKNENDLENGYVDVLDGNQEGCTLNIKTTVPITVKNIKITGGTSIEGRPRGGGIYVSPIDGGANLTIENGTLISENRAVRGAGAYFNGNVVMNGGIITRNSATEYGGGVYSEGSFTMQGGAIRENFAKNGGGILIGSTACSFKMSGGSISENTATDSGGGIMIGHIDDSAILIIEDAALITGNKAERGGGIYFYGNIVMNGGMIAENTASLNGGGVYSHGTFTMHGGTISGNSATSSGGGLFNNGLLTMNGGTITKNNSTTENGVGGGVANNGTFTMQGGTISENSAYRGGGIRCNAGIVTMNAGIISKNTALKKGAGVMITGGARFEMFGGKIAENIAINNGGGGGVCVEGIFLMENGEISNNEAYKGGGICNNSEKSFFTMKDGIITKNKCDGIYNLGELSIIGGKIFENERYGVYNKYKSSGESGKVEMTGGEIYENDYGVVNTAEFKMTGGVIRNNRMCGVQNSDTTSIFLIGGDAYIPFDENGNNYVVLSTPISICGNLTHETVAFIYSSGAQVLTTAEGAESSLLEENYRKFKLMNTNYTINNLGYVVAQ